MTSKPPGRYEYDRLFFSYIEEGALRSARAVVPLVVEALGVRSVLDVGCGAGAWLVEYGHAGATGIGIDGDYVARDQLLIPASSFLARDATQPFDLGRKFDLVQCLEVAEHIPPSGSRTLVANLTEHSDRVLFSAAVPGQGGENHVNERTFEFWRRLFAGQDFVVVDFLRPLLAESDVEPWYAFNTLLYVRRASLAELPEAIRRLAIPDGTPIPDVAPWRERVKRSVLRWLPTPLVTRLAIFKHRKRVRRASGGDR